MYFDMHVHSAFSEGESSLKEIATQAKILGYSGICFAEYFKSKEKMDEIKKEINQISKEAKIKIFLGFEARNANELKKLVKIRREYDVLLVRGYDLKLNRLAVETPEVDILTHPELNRKDSGLNHVLIKEAAKNNVAIELNFRNILINTKATRALIMKHIEQNIRLCKKYKAPVIICSGAISHWQLKDPKVLMSMGVMLGLELKEAKNSLSTIPQKIIDQIKERKSPKWIMPGVKEL
ncbi:MAG: PHP domain-containing protein [Candidatus Aenigmarchaeota archaeon]|nr:PHP domain-containing protein [Candidatus Aenigmarchaeota archaeon]MBU5689019.1 PHP domain-containing protein [Candidatus Aenigmarchaeota archaeon]